MAETTPLPKPLPEHLFTERHEFWQYVTFVYREETHWWERWTEHRDFEAVRAVVERERAQGRTVVTLRQIVRCDAFSEVPDA